MYEEYPTELLVKAVLNLIAKHLTSDFDVIRLVGIHSIFDELPSDAQNFVINNIYIPKSKEQFCPITKMAEFRHTLEIRASL